MGRIFGLYILLYFERHIAFFLYSLDGWCVCAHWKLCSGVEKNERERQMRREKKKVNSSRLIKMNWHRIREHGQKINLHGGFWCSVCLLIHIYVNTIFNITSLRDQISIPKIIFKNIFFSFKKSFKKIYGLCFD